MNIRMRYIGVQGAESDAKGECGPEDADELFHRDALGVDDFFEEAIRGGGFVGRVEG